MDPDDSTCATCATCGTPLRWRDALHGTNGRCKPCTKHNVRLSLAGTFLLSSRDYVASLQRRQARPARRAGLRGGL